MLPDKKIIVTSSVLVTSLLAYTVAKRTGKDGVPYLLIGGFVGDLIGQYLVRRLDNSKAKK